MPRFVFFLDIDDCLIRTSRLTPEHLRVIKNSLEKMKVSKAIEITREFGISFHRMYALHQSEKLPESEKRLVEKYFRRLRELEEPVSKRYGEVKRWSREVCLAIAAEKFNINLSNTVLLFTANNLWREISRQAIFYHDSKLFLQKLIKEKIPFYLITSSDSRLVKDDKSGKFHYTPNYSKKLKYERLEVFTDMDIPKKNIFIGDPVDKPATRIFRQAMHTAKKENKKPFYSVMIGDSKDNDLIPAGKIGMDRLFWLKRDEKNMSVRTDGTIIINKLTQIFPTLTHIT